VLAGPADPGLTYNKEQRKSILRSDNDLKLCLGLELDIWIQDHSITIRVLQSNSICTNPSISGERDLISQVKGIGCLKKKLSNAVSGVPNTPRVSGFSLTA
jgi:hypothetical protein